MIGTALRLETPEGIDLELAPAGPVVRGLAILIDGTITQLASIFFGLILSNLGNTGIGIYFLIAFLVEWFYPVLFEVLRGGQTPGKRAMELRVVNADATPVGWNASLLRNLLRAADFFPLFYAAGLVCMVLTRRYQRLGDLAADTLVVHAPEIEKASKQKDAGAISPLERGEGLGARIPTLPLTPTDQRAILAYAERRRDLSDERAAEIASVLEPLTGARDAEAIREVLRVANGIAGES